MTTTSHLKDEHGLVVNIDYLIRKYSEKQCRGYVRSKLNSVLKTLDGILKEKGRKPGPQKKNNN